MQAHRGYSVATDGELLTRCSMSATLRPPLAHFPLQADAGYASPNPLFMKYTPSEGRFAGQVRRLLLFLHALHHCCVAWMCNRNFVHPHHPSPDSWGTGTGPSRPSSQRCNASAPAPQWRATLTQPWRRCTPRCKALPSWKRAGGRSTLQASGTVKWRSHRVRVSGGGVVRTETVHRPLTPLPRQASRSASTTRQPPGPQPQARPVGAVTARVELAGIVKVAGTPQP